MKTWKGLVAIGAISVFFNVSAQDAPPLSVMQALPTVEALGAAPSVSRNDVLRRPSEVSAEGVIPPFVAEARLLTRGFQTDGASLSYDTDAHVVFLYSNGWWQVEARYHATSTRTNVENCARIPDGTRSYILFEDGKKSDLTVAAIDCPNSFPPPGRPELVIPWLSLCPHPDLPLIDGQRMRRFINLPICRPDIFNVSQNEGFYVLKYLAPEKAFVSELAVTNNGFSVELTVTQNGTEGEIRQYAAPLDRGFLDFHYQVIETTNVNGVKFPLRTICTRASPDSSSKDPSDLRVHLMSELTVTRISFPEGNLASHIVRRAKLFVIDAPAANPPEYETNTVQQQDQRTSVSDPEIQLPLQNSSTQFVELTAWIEGNSWSRLFLEDRSRDSEGQETADKLSIFYKNPNYSLRCVVGTNTWLIEEQNGNGKGSYWFTGTNIVEWWSEMDDSNHSPSVLERFTEVHQSADGNPGRPVNERDLLGFGVSCRICWLALCSGPFLQHEGRRIYPPRSIWKESRLGASGWTDKTTVFKDGLGLPRRLDLLATNNQPVFQYQVHLSTNVLGWNFPLEFYGLQYQPIATNLWRLETSFKGRVTAIRPATKPEIPPEVINSVEKRGSR